MSVSKSDLLGNATHWLEEAKKCHLGGRGVGAIFIFFDRHDIASAVCTATIDKDTLRRHLCAILKKIDDMPLIFSPYERN